MKYLLILVCAASCLMSCAATGGIHLEESLTIRLAETEPVVPETQPVLPVFSFIAGKDWKLIGVYINGEDTRFRRENLPRESAKNCFTLKFDSGTVSGTGAPNLFSAPYVSGDNNSVKILPMRSTLMAALFEPENLKEHEFYIYLQNVSAWELADEKLTLLSKTKDEQEVRLVFDF